MDAARPLFAFPTAGPAAGPATAEGPAEEPPAPPPAGTGRRAGSAWAAPVLACVGGVAATAGLVFAVLPGDPAAAESPADPTARTVLLAPAEPATEPAGVIPAAGTADPVSDPAVVPALHTCDPVGCGGPDEDGGVTLAGGFAGPKAPEPTAGTVIWLTGEIVPLD